MFRSVVDGEVTLIVCVHVDDLVVTAKDQEVFDAFHAKLLEDCLVNDMGDLFWHLGCTFERDKAKGRVKMTQTAFIDSLVKPFQYTV